MTAQLTDDQIREIFEKYHTIAVVGLSPNIDRPSHDVAKYLQAQTKPHSYKLVPVNPNAESVLGEVAYSDLFKVPPEIRIDIVQIFRRPEYVPAIMDQVILRGDANVVWMQDGAGNEEAAEEGRKAGLTVVVNDCMFRQHYRLFRKGQ